MSLQIGAAIGDGVRRSLTKSGGVLMAMMFAYMLVFMASTNSIFVEYLPSEATESGQFALSLPVPVAVAGVLAALAMLFGLVFSIGMTRALTRNHAELSSVPSALFTRRIGRAIVSMIGATILINVAMTIGFVLLFVPGLFLAISFMFAIYAIGVEDARAIESLSRSWELATGNRWQLLGLFVIVVAIAGISGVVSVFFTVVDPLVGQVVYLAVLSIVMVVANGIIADAYVQLKDDESMGGSGGTETPDAPGAAV